MNKKTRKFTLLKQLSFLLFLWFIAATVNGQEDHIALSKRAPANAVPGDLITYTITVGNTDNQAWSGTITDALPDEFTLDELHIADYVSPAPTTYDPVGRTLIWENFPVPPGGTVITVTGFAGKPGSELAVPLPPDAGGYFIETDACNDTATLTNEVLLENGISLTASDSTLVNQISDFYVNNGTGSIHQATGATMRYLVVVQNLGNVWDQYTLYTNPLNPEYAACENPYPLSSNPGANVPLNNAILDLNGQPITSSIWIPPGGTYPFYLQLTNPNGTPANRWNCTDLVVTSVLCGSERTETFHTATIGNIQRPYLYIYNVDYPDPIACEDTLTYTIFLSNAGRYDAYNTTITHISDPYFDQIYSDPDPGTILSDGFASLDIQGIVLPDLTGDQTIVDTIIVTYDEGDNPPTIYSDTVVSVTTVRKIPDLVIEKSASNTLVSLGDTITYTITYSNIGCGPATGVTIEDDYEEGQTSIIDNGGGTVSAGKLIFNIGDLSPQDGEQTLEYSLVVTDVNCGTDFIENDIIIRSDTIDGNVINNSAARSVLALTAPTWERFPADLTVDCDNIPAHAVIGDTEGGVWAVDNCYTVTISELPEDTILGDCDESYTLIRTWTAETEYSSIERSQYITVIDTTAPVISCPSFTGYITSVDGTGQITVTLEGNAGIDYLVSNNDFNATATDNCDGSPALAYILTGNTTGTGADLNGVTFNSGITEVSWTATDGCGNVEVCGFTVVVGVPSITLEKTLEDIDGEPAAVTYDTVGNVLNYSFTIENTGTMTLYDVEVTDPDATVTGTVIPELAPGAVNNTSFTASYVITQADLDRGDFTNIATVSGTAVTTAEVSDSDTLTVSATQNASLDLTKTSTTDPNTYSAVDDILSYEIVVSNSGNVTLSDITVTDNLTDSEWTILTLAPGESQTYTPDYTIVQADLDVGQVVNSASAEGTDPDDAPVSASDVVTINATQNASLDLTKTSITDPNTYSAVNDVLSYEIEVSNSGNVTLYDITVTDTLTNNVWTIATLAPGQSQLYTTSYQISQEDLNVGHVINSASAEGTDPDDAPVTASDVETVNANQLFTLEVTKSSDKTDYVYAGETITYQIVLENIGNVNLLDISVDDVLSAATSFLQADQGGSYNGTNRTVSWTVSQLNPAEIITFELSVVVDLDVVNETVISNVAITENELTFMTESNEVELIALQLPELQLISVNDIACYGDQTGSISVDVTGGLAPFTTFWQHDASETEWDLSNLPAGNYRVIVTDALGNTDELSITVEQPDGPLSGTLNASDALCYGESSGSIALDPEGGTTPYSFLWSNASTAQNIENLSAGTYSVIITDANGCTWSGEADVDAPEQALSITGEVDAEVICMDDPSGSISVEIGGGTPPYAFLWDTGETTQDLSDAIGGEHSLTVTDANGCQEQEDFYIDYLYEECEIAIPGGLTPYGEFDRRFVIQGLEKYPDNNLKIFNRYGTMVYEADPYTNDWSGEANMNHSLVEGDGKIPSGTYFYILTLKPGDEPKSGYIIVIKD